MKSQTTGRAALLALALLLLMVFNLPAPVGQGGVTVTPGAGGGSSTSGGGGGGLASNYYGATWSFGTRYTNATVYTAKVQFQFGLIGTAPTTAGFNLSIDYDASGSDDFIRYYGETGLATSYDTADFIVPSGGVWHADDSSTGGGVTSITSGRGGINYFSTNGSSGGTGGTLDAATTNWITLTATNAARAATTNTYDYIAKADLVTPLPNIYMLSSYGTNHPTEGEIVGYINQIYTNGYTAYGFDTVQLDAGWATRNASGLLIMNTNVWTNSLAYLCQYAHNRGVKIGVYYSIETNSGWNVHGAVNMHTNMQADIDTLVTNGVDVIKVDTFNTPQGGQDPITFWNAVAKSGRAIHRQVSIGDFGNSGNYYALSPASAAGLNSAYVAYGLPDTNLTPLKFTNSFQHFLRSLAARHFVSPSFKIDGTGWLMEGLRNQYQYPNHCFVDMALMTAERLMMAPSHDSFNLTNRYLLKDLFQASPVTVADIVLTNDTDMVCSRVIGNRQDGVRAICFINPSETSRTMTYSLADLGFSLNEPVTYYSPWFWNSLEGWATNTIAVTVPPTNTVLYKVVRGYRAQYGDGVTYLSDLSWASTCNIPRGPSYEYYTAMLARNYREENPATPLIINSTTYAKGFSAGASWMGTTNPMWEVNIGVYNTNAYLYTDFGKQQVWNGGSSAVRLTIYTNGTSSVVSGWVTNNSTQSVSYRVPLDGVYKIGFLVETNGAGACQAVLGGCYIYSPPVFSGTMLDPMTGWTNGEAWFRPTTNLWGQTNLVAWYITNETFQVTLVPGTYKYDLSLHFLTASTTGAATLQFNVVTGDYAAGWYLRAPSQSSSVTYINGADMDNTKPSMVIGTQDPPATKGIGFGSGLLVVNATNTYRVLLCQRTTADTANRPYLTTNSFMYFKRLSP